MPWATEVLLAYQERSFAIELIILLAECSKFSVRVVVAIVTITATQRPLHWAVISHLDVTWFPKDWVTYWICPDPVLYIFEAPNALICRVYLALRAQTWEQLSWHTEAQCSSCFDLKTSRVQRWKILSIISSRFLRQFKWRFPWLSGYKEGRCWPRRPQPTIPSCLTSAAAKYKSLYCVNLHLFNKFRYCLDLIVRCRWMRSEFIWQCDYF